MSTKRTPIRRSPAKTTTIAPRAVEVFKLMQDLPACSCVNGPKYWEVIECDGCSSLG